MKEAICLPVESPDDVGNLLYLSMPSLYAVRQNISKSSVKKHMIHSASFNNSMQIAAANGMFLHTTLSVTLIILATSGTDIILGGLYDPALQSDYGSNIFAHDKARLKAHPFYDKYNRLLKPWSLPVSLRVGTLIIFEATFHCYNYAKHKVCCIVLKYIL